jgi:molybdenum cofactor guanylyltransferase
MSWSIVIQAGGQSRRMGQNKALMPFLEQPLIERVVQRLKHAADEILINTNQPDLFSFLKLAMFPDLIPGKGPLGGLFTALSVAKFPLVAVVACDMPFINPQLLTHERDLLGVDEWDVVLPRSNDGLDPLHAVYRKDACLPAIRLALDEDRLRMVSWIGDVKVREMGIEELLVIDPDLRSFINVNTPDEFRRAEQLEQPFE